MTEPRRFDIRELSGADDTNGDAELGQALAIARAVESALAGPEARPSPELVDRVMAAVAREPAPRPDGILASLRRRPGLAGLLDSLQVGWSRAASSGRPIGLRAGGLAYVAAVVLLAASLTGVATYTTAGALRGIGLFGPPASQVSPATPGLPTPGPLTSPEPGETETASPSETPEPSEAVEPSDDHGGSSGGPGDSGGGGANATDLPEASDSQGGGDGGSSVTQTPRPSQVARPSESPGPTSSSGD